LTLVANYEMICYTRQIGVTEVRENDCFQPELTRIFISREQIFFDGYIHAQIFINSAIDGTHAALPQNLDNSITFVQ